MWFYSFCCYREYGEYDVIELSYTVKVPVQIFFYPYCSYKYCVMSKSVEEFMTNPFEFIHGRDWSRTGSVINRSLKISNCPHIIKDSK